MEDILNISASRNVMKERFLAMSKAKKLIFLAGMLSYVQGLIGSSKFPSREENMACYILDNVKNHLFDMEKDEDN
tara:strand:+ start:997 stop:1221 length:225 start_codon:yes stop_codon:yes gene_type:complete